jgi:hypothetical protein
LLAGIPPKLSGGILFDLFVIPGGDAFLQQSARLRPFPIGSRLVKLPISQFDFLSEQAGGADVDVRAQVSGLLSALYPRNDFIERRRDNRYPFPCLVHLTPVSPDGVTPEGETVVVVGKHLSEQGFSFYHREPLPHRRMIASLERKNGHWFGFLIDLNWCRFSKGGWYESGGRFLQTAYSPMEKKAKLVSSAAAMSVGVPAEIPSLV